MSSKVMVLSVTLLIFSGCATQVQPWQKEALAEEAMQKDGGNKLHKQFQEHIYYSKEASKGGAGVAGGGCGCN